MSFFKNIDLPESESGLGEKAVTISSETDLPEADENGVIQLEDNKVYFFQDFIFSQNTLSLGENTPLIGLHGGASGFIHIGGQTVLTSNGNPVLMRDLYLHSPGGILFDLDGIDTSTEFLVESCSFSDAVGQGNMVSLGEIANFRVPTFKGCNFEDFEGGLKFTGASDKIFFSSSVFRDVPETTEPVTIINFDSNYNIDIADITDCYIKAVQDDTVFWNIETGGKPNEITILKGTTFDNSITKSNILTGEADPTNIRVKTDSNYPLANSTPTGSLIDEPEEDYTVEGSGESDTRIEMTNSQELVNDSKVSTPSSGVIQYDDVYDVRINVSIILQVTTTTDSFIVKLYRSQEGSEEWSEVTDFALYGSKRANETAATVTGSKICEADAGCQFALYIQNLDDNADLDIRNFNLQLG